MKSPAKTPTADFPKVLALIQSGKNRAHQAVNTTLVETYAAVGAWLSAKVCDGGWGKGVVKELAGWLSVREPGLKGFSAQNLWRMKQFHETFAQDPKLSAVPRVLNWTQICILMAQCKDPEELLFYGLSAARDRWSTRELETQIRKGAFERTALATLRQAKAPKLLPARAHGVFKDSYLLDFLDLPERHLESDLQGAIVANLRRFLLELGGGFAFVGEKVRLQVGMRDFELDLLFYHRDLRCLVAFELKTGAFEPEHLGQLSFYLEALDRDHRRPDENPSIGVLLCRRKDDDVVEYALSRTLSPALVSEYETRLVPRELLRQKLNEWAEMLEDRTGLEAREVGA